MRARVPKSGLSSLDLARTAEVRALMRDSVAAAVEKDADAARARRKQSVTRRAAEKLARVATQAAMKLGLRRRKNRRKDAGGISAAIAAATEESKEAAPP